MANADIGVRTTYLFECFDAQGNLKWREEKKNLMTYVGLNDMGEKYFEGSSYTAAFYLGLVDATGTQTYSANDTMSSHAGWAEFTTYSGTRPVFNPGTWSNGVASNTLNKATFTITTGGTIAGGFLCTNSTVGGTTGILFSVADFSGGDKTVVATDVLQVTLTVTLAQTP